MQNSKKRKIKTKAITSRDSNPQSRSFGASAPPLPTLNQWGSDQLSMASLVLDFSLLTFSPLKEKFYKCITTYLLSVISTAIEHDHYNPGLKWIGSNSSGLAATRQHPFCLENLIPLIIILRRLLHV